MSSTPLVTRLFEESAQHRGDKVPSQAAWLQAWTAQYCAQLKILYTIAKAAQIELRTTGISLARVTLANGTKGATTQLKSLLDGSDILSALFRTPPKDSRILSSALREFVVFAKEHCIVE